MKLPLLLTCLALCGCVSGSHLVTGTPRTAVPIESVRVYDVAPTNSQTIGTVTADGDGLKINQSTSESAMKALKKHAAAMGANGLVLSEPSRHAFGFVLTGKAIYVP